MPISVGCNILVSTDNHQSKVKTKQREYHW